MIPSRKFDEKMADMRQNYGRFSPANKEKFRDCLERLAPVASDMLECAHFLVSVKQEFDLEDEEGNPTSFMVEFDPQMLLEAVKAWDAGENYTPAAMSTYYG